MRWVRARRRFGGQLALSALAVQLIVSFGHLHPDDIYGPAKLAVDAPIALSAADRVVTLSTDHHTTHEDAFCEICATISLLNTSLVAAAPQLPLPLVSRVFRQADRIAIISFTPQRAPFQSRAPPAA